MKNNKKDKIQMDSNEGKWHVWDGEKAKWVTPPFTLEREELVEILKECRDMLVMCTLIDKSNQCNEMVEKADKVLSKYTEKP